MSLLSLPWTWKLLWAPLVDRYGARQHWITVALFALGATTLAIVPQDPSDPSWLMWGLLLLFGGGLALAAATLASLTLLVP